MCDSNDSPPAFSASPYRVSLSENVIAGHAVLTVSASDPDEGSTLTYTLLNEKHFFRLDPTAGVLYLTQPLDRETNDLHTIRIRADDGMQFTETSIVIEVKKIFFFLVRISVLSGTEKFYFIIEIDLFRSNMKCLNEIGILRKSQVISLCGFLLIEDCCLLLEKRRHV